MTTRSADGRVVLRDRRRIFGPDMRHAVPASVQAKFVQQRILDQSAIGQTLTTFDLIPSRPTYVPKIRESTKSRAMREKARLVVDAALADDVASSTKATSTMPHRRNYPREEVVDTKVTSDAEDMAALLVTLDLEDVSTLRLDDDDHEKSMTQDDFIAAMATNMTAHRINAVESTMKLCQLFHKIDHDEDGLITWAEFASFVLETMRGYSEQLLVDGLHEVATTNDRVLAFEEQSKAFEVFDSHDGRILATSSPCSGGHLVDLVIVPLMDYIVGSTSSTTIDFWDGTDYLLRQQLPTTEVQTVVRWNDQHTLLYSASVTGHVHAWNCETLECKGSVNLPSQHTVTDMTFLSPRANAVVASFAPEIAILDLGTNKLLNELRGHRLGVSRLCYSLQQRYILSAGMDHDLRLWNPYVETSLVTLQGHRHQIVGLTWIDGSPEVHSLDQAGFLKIWDLRTYRCIQTLSTLGFSPLLDTTSINHSMDVMKSNAGVKMKPTSALTYLADQNRVVVASSRVIFHDAVLWNTSDENALEKETPSMALFMPASLVILTIAGRHVRVWNAQTGILVYNLRHLVPTIISAGCYGSGPFSFLGTQSGHIYSLNVMSGALLRNRRVHSREVRDVTLRRHFSFQVSGLEMLEFRDRAMPHRLVSISLDGTCILSDMETLAPLSVLNHWYGLNSHAATRISPMDTSPSHDYFVPQQSKQLYTDYALDCLKRIFAHLDPDRTGELAAAAVPAAFDAVAALNGRTCQRNRAHLTQCLASLRHGRLPFLDFLTVRPLVLPRHHAQPASQSPDSKGYATSEIHAVGVSHKFNAIVTATLDAHFCIWDGAKCRPLASSSPAHVRSGITAVLFLEPHPLFVCTDDRGGLSLFAVPPHPQRFECLFATASSSDAVAHSLAWCLPHSIVTGDDEGASHRVGPSIDDTHAPGHITCWRVDGFVTKKSDGEASHPLKAMSSARQLMQSTRPKTDTRRRRRRSSHEFDYSRDGRIVRAARWLAHVDAICSLNAREWRQTATHLLTCGWDGFVRAWDLAGESVVGTLIHGPQENPQVDDHKAWTLTVRNSAMGKLDERSEAMRFLAAFEQREKPKRASSPPPLSSPHKDPNATTARTPRRPPPLWPKVSHLQMTMRHIPKSESFRANHALFEEGEFVVSPMGTRYAMRLQEALDALDPTMSRSRRKEKKADPRIERIELALKVLSPARSKRSLRTIRHPGSEGDDTPIHHEATIPSSGSSSDDDA
ncbi:Aste57867_13231 [Aphanomyces stellatus]|uniref:Aste57867_13231 protein n=1 Tax=Aphanomyces stellatus TaxID=120398 RepID=A0A485KXW6_9STRA|nr:hypothetical protein As57867_013182 [Aphanomyces stellatus]VFT90071.1 Aste57867_13231 [Aphanomyces stellatus]